MFVRRRTRADGLKTQDWGLTPEHQFTCFQWDSSNKPLGPLHPKESILGLAAARFAVAKGQVYVGECPVKRFSVPAQYVFSGLQCPVLSPSRPERRTTRPRRTRFFASAHLVGTNGRSTLRRDDPWVSRWWVGPFSVLVP